MRHAFYDSPEYRRKQGERTKLLVKTGKYNHLKKVVSRTCARSTCTIFFLIQPHNPKKYCSSKCAALVTTPGRKHSLETKKRISSALTGLVNPHKGVRKVPLEERICKSAWCKKTFFIQRYKPKKFCSVECAGKRPTSPKASRGKAGIRLDISPTIFFYSRWEANIARLYSYLGINWQYAPTTFDIGNQRYTPDFYLPEQNLYVEVKNFLSDFSKKRDEKFRTHYPKLPLKLLLKDEYLSLEKEYSPFISSWEKAGGGKSTVR